MTALQAMAKAVAAGCTAASTALIAALADDGVSGGEVAVIVLGGIAGFAVTYAVPNRAA